MKTILYNPIFINPQAYYVFPRLTRYLQPDNESTSEPANYIGTIEVKVIAYGDTTLKRTYTNTDSIDLSEFKNTWIRISLFTKVGSCVLGEWKIGNMESDLPYIDPEVLASLKAVVIVGNKTNNDSDRAIVKNLVDASNPFVISNASFKLNSGFGGFVEDFTSWDRIDSSTAEISNDGSKIKCINTTLNVQYLFNSINRDIPSFKVKISNFTKGDITYYYRKEDGIEAFLKINPLSVVNSDKVIELPKSYNTVENGTGSRGGFYSSNINIGVTITQIPSFEGAFVTDGIDDLITSTKTVQEMLGGSNEITVVSMIHQIDGNVNYTNGYTNYIRHGGGFIRNSVSGINGKGFNKTGIYGYTSTQLDSSNMGLGNVINNILGDKKDYSFERSSTYTLDDAKYSVQNFVNANNQPSNEGSSVAWYWTIIANKVLTTDQINQVIAYFNLDRTLKSDIYCNIAKQGITNENHAEFGDKLIDFSGNGRDIQLNNIAWDGDSGIGKYNYPNWKVNVTQGNKYARIVYYDSINGTYSANFKGITDLYKSYGLSIEIRVNRANTIDFHSIKEDGIYTITPPDDTTSMDIRFGGEDVYNASCNITITQIPSHAGALCLDGVNDFGKVTGMPIYKDYTFISKYQRLSYREAIETEGGAVIASKSYSRNQGAFIFNGVRGDYAHDCYSFGLPSSNNLINDKNLEVYYQTKYTNQGKSISSGTAADSDILWLGTVRDNDNRFINAAIYSLMSFPYSMSEFLIERQLKKHKLGTLYPDMVELRPIIKANAEHGRISYYNASWNPINVGDYLEVGARVNIVIDRLNIEKITEIKVSNAEYVGYNFDEELNHWNVLINLTSKSPQKINITIDEYIRYEDIVQPYPVLLRFDDENGNEVSWGGKFRVGSTITRIGSIDDPESNLLNGLYSISGLSLNGKPVTRSTSIVEKQMVFRTTATWLLDNNEPKVILSPSRLRIPNSSYKLLGYIPDISGHGNNGVINNSAYAEGSGVNEDGSYQFDGVDDFVTIPTTVGGKQVLMKVNWDSPNASILYDQRGYNNEFAIYNGTNDSDGNPIPAYQGRNNGQTYIDGILNSNIKASELRTITHNITITNELSSGANKTYPIIGSSKSNAYFVNMALYDFMLFDEISTDDKIKELNEYVGIEGNTE